MQKLQTILISILIIVALFTSIYFPYKWKQLSNDFLNQTNQYGELLNQINDLQKEVRELKNGDGEVNNLKDWKIYRNEEYGFEVKYPDTIKLISNNGNIDFKKEEINYRLSISAKIKPRISNKISNPECYKEIDVKTFNNIKWSINDFLCGMGDKTSIYYSTTYNDNVFEVSFYSDDLVNKIQRLNQILSTFKFIEKDEITDWKTYKNEKYGFEVKYPEDWKRESDVLSEIFFQKFNRDSNEFVCRFSVNIISNKLFDDYIKDYYVKPRQQTDIDIGKISAIKIDDVLGSSYFIKREDGKKFSVHISIVIEKFISSEDGSGKIAFGFLDDPKCFKIFNQILSTFKFIE